MWQADDSERVWCDATNYPADGSFLSKSDAELRELASEKTLRALHARSCMDARARAIQLRQDAERSHQEDWGWYLEMFAVISTVPPLLVMLLGLVTRWVIDGFRRPLR